MDLARLWAEGGQRQRAVEMLGALDGATHTDPELAEAQGVARLLTALS